jgi:hypothetical protein
MGSGIREVFLESVSAVTDTASADIGLGTVRYEGGNEYQYIYNGGGASAIVGRYVKLTGTTYTATVTGTSKEAQVFGVVQSNTLTTGAYAWVLKRGVTTFVGDTNASFAAGDGICAGTDGAFINASAGAAFYVASGTTTTSWADGLTYPLRPVNIVGYAVQAIATAAGSGLAYFNIP